MLIHDYPLFVNLSKMSCLVVGAGTLGQRKISGLLRAKVQRLVIIDPTIDELFPENQSLISSTECIFVKREFVADDVNGHQLVFSATNKRDVNWLIAVTCAERHIFCNVVDNSGLGSCITPAVSRHNHLILALSSGGISPSLSRRIKNELAEHIVQRYDKQILLLEKFRPLILLSNMVEQEKVNTLNALASERVMHVLNSKDRVRIENMLYDIISPKFHQVLVELMDELV